MHLPPFPIRDTVVLESWIKAHNDFIGNTFSHVYLILYHYSVIVEVLFYIIVCIKYLFMEFSICRSMKFTFQV